jgi:hypothetical protein
MGKLKEFINNLDSGDFVLIIIGLIILFTILKTI